MTHILHHISIRGEIIYPSRVLIRFKILQFCITCFLVGEVNLCKEADSCSHFFKITTNFLPVIFFKLQSEQTFQTSTGKTSQTSEGAFTNFFGLCETREIRPEFVICKVFRYQKLSETTTIFFGAVGQ